MWCAAAEIQIEINDPEGAALPCRVRFADESGQFHSPVGAPVWNGGFICKGTAVLQVPEGRCRYVIERGPEWTTAEGEVLVSEEAQKVSVELKRLTNLRTEHWYGGDLHVHRAIEEMAMHLEAEDLAVASVQSWWNESNPWKLKQPGDLVRTTAGRSFHVLSGEDERGGGALLYHLMDRTVDITGSEREWPPSTRFLHEAKERNAWVELEKPFWWDTPLWLSTGKVDSIGLAHNHMNRREVLGNEAWGRPRDSERYPGIHGNGLYTQDLYYKILNSGFRMPPSAGSASGVLPNPVGYNRVYVHTGDAFEWDSWWEGLRAGRCFVTNGPLLRLTANGQVPGEVFNSESPLKLRIEGKLDSRDAIDRVELIHNGNIRQIELPTDIELEESGWFLVRAITDVKETFRFASTAPWYVEIGGKPMPPNREAATFFLKWAKERRANVAEAISDPDRKRELIDIHDRGIDFWKDIQSQAPNPWPVVSRVDAQPLLLLMDRLVEAMETLGEPLDAEIVDVLDGLRELEDDATICEAIQELFDSRCLLAIEAHSKSGLRLVPGQGTPKLFDNGWRNFLIKVTGIP